VRTGHTRTAIRPWRLGDRPSAGICLRHGYRTRLHRDQHRRQRQAAADYAGTALFVVNVASQCGLTPQYAGLQQLHEKYRRAVSPSSASPANQFGAQEPGSEGQIKTFCETRFGVTFRCLRRSRSTAPAVTRFLRVPHEPGDRTRRAGRHPWNFAKFLVGKDGTVLARFSPTETPELAGRFAAAVEKAL
jgi:glutathione peroxidase